MPSSQPQPVSPSGIVTLPAELKTRLQDCPTLPSLPNVVMQVIALARSPDASLHDLAHSLEQDPALTARLLALANSVLYSPAKATESCVGAVSRLGLDATLSVALGFGLIKGHDRRHAWRLNYDHFWQRSLVSALASHRLATQTERRDTGSLFTIALLQDIGMLALDATLPELYAELPTQADDHSIVIELERQHLGCDHACVGAWLADQWGLPERLVDGIANSHATLSTCSHQNRCIIAASLIADAWLSTTPAIPFADLLPRLLHHLEFDSANLGNLLTALESDLPSLARLFEITQPPAFDSHQALLEAKQLLHAHNLRLNEALEQQRQELEYLRHRHELLDHRIRFDALTGLYNRAYLEELLNELFLTAKRERSALAVIFIDLDHFKQLNDRYGHRLGDEVLENFAELLRGLLSTQVQGGRYGGEEFLLILPDAPVKQAKLVAETMSRRLADTPMATVDGRTIHVTASIGIAHMGCNEFENAHDLIHVADQGMYMAKRGGRARISHFSPAAGKRQ
ncbi:hypothetical protein GCM10007160_01430 [Litchfieldella qijiaojingensis]|uniref:diguanylate cyclase n=1 Tax=Litchfieldella qijiaojingensis TaxID=980347 RepID=A0ABQ2YAD8_9GAMM|nr:GGDEF domain-containing protein [Halomonas qijiaojingensis]GGX77916.1 hypothetical protein GCM10007160_01430 [Halomonas qijiaojingensis]